MLPPLNPGREKDRETYKPSEHLLEVWLVFSTHMLLCAPFLLFFLIPYPSYTAGLSLATVHMLR